MTHCAQAGTLSPRTTEPPVVHKELAEVLANPVIAVVRSAEELAEALTSRVSAIEIRSGDIASLPALIDRVRAARKSVLLYPELIAGLGRDPAAIDFLCGYARPTAIVSTKKQILQKARACGLITIFQIFMIDTKAFETGIQTARRLDCDAVESMPGAIPHIIGVLCFAPDWLKPKLKFTKFLKPELRPLRQAAVHSGLPAHCGRSRHDCSA